MFFFKFLFCALLIIYGRLEIFTLEFKNGATEIYQSFVPRFASRTPMSALMSQDLCSTPFEAPLVNLHHGRTLAYATAMIIITVIKRCKAPIFKR